ncbi:MAG: hypothetical protein ACKVP7_03260 [Hyphomicrobiaceae bacterium]
MVDKLDLGMMGQVLQTLKDYSTIVLPVVAFLVVLILVAKLLMPSGRSEPASRHQAQGFLARTTDAFIRAFTTNWQLTLLATTAFVLSLASGWTTWDGMRNFTGEPILSFMVTFGIQGVMLIIAWIIGESFASGMNNRSSEDRVRSKGEVIGGMVVGLLLAVGVLASIAKAFGAFSFADATSGSFSFAAMADKALYLGVGLLLIFTLLLNNKSDIAQPYLQSARIMAKNAVLWVMLLATMATSVFFSFDSLFSAIFPQSERKRAAEIRAVNQVAGVVSDIGALTQRRQAEEAERLFQGDGWKAYEKNLLELSRQSQGAEQLIEAYFVQQMESRRRAIAEQQERVSSAQSGQAGLVAKKASLTDELSRLKAERPTLAGELTKVKTELDERARALDAKRVEAMAEERGAEGTLKVGKGPQYRERVAELARMQDAYKIQEERVRDANKRLGAIDGRIVQIERELAAVDGDIAKLKGEAQTAEQRIQAAEATKSGDEGPKVDPARVRGAFERARAEFRQDPTIDRLNAVTQQCAQLLGAMTATPATKERVRGIDCDPKPAAEAAGRVFALNAGIENFAKHCAGGDKLPQAATTDTLLSFGRKCLQDSGLPSKDSGEMSSKLSAIDLNRDDKAHRFVVTWNAFLDGNRLAYLALAIAIAIDSLVFMSGLFGANAVRSPLTDLEGRSELTAEQLEAAIDATLKTTSDPKATLAALLRSLHPVNSSDGFSSEIILDPREPLVDDMRAVLVAGSTIGAVRRTGADRGRYLVSTGLARYCAVAQRKTWVVHGREVDRKELVNVIGVALLPDPQNNADIVLGELHPISDAVGYAAETYPTKIADVAHQRLVRNVLGAGATIQGAVQRDKDRYFVSTDVYKTLLMMRAAAIPAFRLENLEQRPALSQAREAQPRPLQAQPVPQLPRPPQHPPHPQQGPHHHDDRMPHILGEALLPPMPSVQPPGPVMPGLHSEGPPPLPPLAPQARPLPRAVGSELELSLGNTIRNELIQIGGLFPWDTRDVAIARMIGRNGEPEKALKRLSNRAPRLTSLIGDAIDDNRASVRAAFEELAAHHAHDPVYIQVLETVSSELDELMPLLMLSPGGPYQQILERLIYDLEPQDAEGVLSPTDRRILDGARGQVEALKGLADGRPDRLMQVARIVDSYDERLLGPHHGQHANDDIKRTLN